MENSMQNFIPIPEFKVNLSLFAQRNAMEKSVVDVHREKIPCHGKSCNNKDLEVSYTLFSQSTDPQTMRTHQCNKFRSQSAAEI